MAMFAALLFLTYYFQDICGGRLSSFPLGCHRFDRDRFSNVAHIRAAHPGHRRIRVGRRWIPMAYSDQCRCALLDPGSTSARSY
jgi:hypothetical protein